MENNKQVKDPYRSALKKKAMAYMPKNYEDVTAQKQILAMIVAVVPAAASVSKAAETSIWPKVQSKAVPIVQAVGQCAMSIDKVIAAAPMESLLLEKRSSEMLMKAWVALEYYSYLMLPEYSVNIRALRDRMFAILRQRDTGAAPARPATPAQAKAAPVQPKASPVTAVPVQRTSGQPVMPKPKVPMPQPPVVKPPVPPKPPVGMAEDLNKTVMVERKPEMFQAEDLNKTVMVERKPEMFQAEDLGKTVNVAHTPEIPKAPEMTQMPPAQDPDMFSEAEDFGSTVSVQRDSASGKGKKGGSKAPIAIVAALVVVIAVVAVILAGGSKAVEKAEEAIGSIGTVTLESKDEIEAAEALYEELSDGNKKKVENREALFAARSEYDRQANAIAEVETAIDAIGSNVTLSSKDAIDKARKLYDGLDADLKDDVSNYADLKTKEARYATLYAEDQAEKLYAAAKSAHASGDYDKAISKINQLLDNYPGTSKEMSAKTLGADCVAVSAQTALNENRLEEAMVLLKRAQEDYVSTEEVKNLMDRLITKLEGMRPANGKMFAVKTEQGYCKMVITAKGSDLCIKLTSKSNPEKYTFYYIREGEKFAMHVKDGQYTLKYCFGDYWYGQEELFGAEGEYRSMDETFTLNTFYSGGWVQYEYYEFTLDINGDWNEKTITRDQF